MSTTAHRPHHKGKLQLAKLTYNAAGELLTGQVGTMVLHDLAYSGGSRGHKEKVAKAKAARYLLDNPLNDSRGRLATTAERYDKKTDTYSQRGGTIPPGHYHCVYLANHAPFGECIRLDPMADAYAIHSPFSRIDIPHHRGGFYIHGHGPKGSDGCIVFAVDQRRRELNRAVHNFVGKVQLEVVHVSYELPAELEASAGEVTT